MKKRIITIGISNDKIKARLYGGGKWDDCKKNIDELFQIIEKIGKENAGIITTKQIEAAGIYRGLIKVFVEDGRLIKEAKGLYSLANELPVKVENRNELINDTINDIIKNNELINDTIKGAVSWKQENQKS